MRCHQLALPAIVAGLAVAACGSDTSTSSSSGVAATTSTTTTSTHTYTCATGTVTAHGSTALQPLVAAAATAYQTACPGATVNVSGGGSSEGLSKVFDGTFDIGDSDVPASAAKTIDASQLTDHQVAIVAFAVIVNPKTQVTKLTTAQVQQIFSGAITNWSQIPGGANVPVSLTVRKPGSGTRLTFDKTTMKGTAESASAPPQDSTQLVLSAVGDPNTPGGVSYVASGSVNSTVVAVSIDDANPTADDVKSGKYAFWSHEHMYTKGQGSAIARSLIDFMLTDSFQTGTLLQQHFLPLSTTDKQSLADV